MFKPFLVTFYQKTKIKVTMIQLDFFQPMDDLDLIRADIKSVKDSSDKVRRGMFARHNELAKMLMDVSQRLEIIERNICTKS